MSNDFVKEVYKVLTPVVINWVDFHANYDEIVEYSSKRYRAVEGFNSMTFYQYAIYVNAGTYDDKYECFIEWLELRDDLGEYLRGNICDE